MIELESLLQRNVREDTFSRVEKDLMRVSSLDTSQSLHYQGMGKNAVAEWKKIEPKELERIRDHVEAKLGVTYVRSGGTWKEVADIVQTGRSIINPAKIVRFGVKI